jgi:hypothetical protein
VLGMVKGVYSEEIFVDCLETNWARTMIFSSSEG